MSVLSAAYHYPASRTAKTTFNHGSVPERRGRSKLWSSSGLISTGDRTSPSMIVALGRACERDLIASVSLNFAYAAELSGAFPDRLHIAAEPCSDTTVLRHFHS